LDPFFYTFPPRSRESQRLPPHRSCTCPLLSLSFFTVSGVSRPKSRDDLPFGLFPPSRIFELPPPPLYTVFFSLFYLDFPFPFVFSWILFDVVPFPCSFSPLTSFTVFFFFFLLSLQHPFQPGLFFGRAGMPSFFSFVVTVFPVPF